MDDRDGEKGKARDPMNAMNLSPEQWEFLSWFSSNGAAGRRFLCWIAHAIVAIGMVAGALAAVLALAQQFFGLRAHP